MCPISGCKLLCVSLSRFVVGKLSSTALERKKRWWWVGVNVIERQSGTYHTDDDLLLRFT